VSNLPINYLAADREFYAPLETARGGEPYAPTAAAEGWTSTAEGLWTSWYRPGEVVVEAGWKVHVSARPERAARVLDVVAAVCFEQDVIFKHLSNTKFFEWLHHKYAARPQSGKFIAAYPPDVRSARTLMERLRAELEGERGPYVLTDRRYGDSGNVFYRYGSFAPRYREEPDGTRTPTVRLPDGSVVPDPRGNGFRLPEGVSDPFIATKAATARAKTAGKPTLGGFLVESSVRFTNAGGTYRCLDEATGRRVFVKEARPYVRSLEGDGTAPEQLDREWRVLTRLHELDPGLAPEPIARFRVWEHEYIAVEHVEGVLLSRWLAVNTPLLRPGWPRAQFAPYYERCEKLLAQLEAQLQRLKAAGYLFIDVSPGNILVDADDSVRLVDFGLAHRIGEPFVKSGTPGFTPPERFVGDDPSVYDAYGLAALAQFLLGPLNAIAQANPDVLAHAYADLVELAPVPDPLWHRATRYLRPGDGPGTAGAEPIPTPEQVAADPRERLARLRDRIADALLAAADPTDARRVFPTIPQGLQTNTVGLAYGTAGVVHALRGAGRELPDGLLERLRRDATAKRASLPPGLYVGTAGAAWVLADCGLFDEARDLLAAADDSALTRQTATLYAGSSGLLLAHLALYGHTLDERHVERACALADSLPRDDSGLESLIGADNATGLMHGRTGVALALQQLAGVTGQQGYLRRAISLLHAELDRAVDPDAPGLLFPMSAKDGRIVPYLFSGTAGLTLAATRCLRLAEDERLAEAMPRLLLPLRQNYTIMPGLFQGLSGLVFTLAEHAVLTGEGSSESAALRGARSLFKYAIPHPTGVRVLGDQLARYSCELWSGSAGVLLALSHVLDPSRDALFTVDALVDARWTPRPAPLLSTSMG
jgi:Lanthionine synthetase C-like protein/Protein kinase domain